MKTLILILMLLVALPGGASGQFPQFEGGVRECATGDTACQKEQPIDWQIKSAALTCYRDLLPFSDAGFRMVIAGPRRIRIIGTARDRFEFKNCLDRQGIDAGSLN